MYRSIEEKRFLPCFGLLAAVVKQFQKGMGESNGTALRPFGASSARAHAVNEGVRSRTIPGVFECRPGSSRIDPGMIVRSSDYRLDPGCRTLRLNPVLESEAIDGFRR